MEGGGLEEDHVAGDAGEVEVEDKSEGKGKEGAAAEGQTRARGVEKTNSRHEEVQGQVGKYVDCFDYALRIKDYEAIRIMAEIVCKPLVEQFGYLPGKMTKLLRRLMHRDYHELVGTILASIPLAVEGENDPRKTNVLLTTPLCDLGTLSFLTQLAEKSDTSVFDTDIVALVVEKLWEDHIRMKFMKDFCLLMTFWFLWAIQCDKYSVGADDWKKFEGESVFIMIVLVCLNTYFALKELRQAKKTADLKGMQDDELEEAMAGWGAQLMEGWVPAEGGAAAPPIKAKQGKKKKASWAQIGRSYLSDPYNWFDLSNIILVYFSTISLKMHVDSDIEVACATIGSFTLTFKALGFLRGFAKTGWLVKVLNQNFADMIPFIIIMLMLIFGFAVIFRLTLNDLPGGDCGVDAVTFNATPAEWSCDPNPYGSFSRSMANVFSMSILGDFDTALFDNASNGKHNILCWTMFIFMQVYMAVVCLNALIALLGDSYGDVQQNQFANMRKERATLIVEHLIVMDDKERKKIQESSRTVITTMSKKDWATKKKSLGERLFQSDWDTTEYMVGELKGQVESLQNQIDELVVKMGK